MIGLVEKERETSRKKRVMQEEISLLKERESSLSEEIAKLKTEEGIEESIREKFQVSKPGEKMVIIVDDDANDDLSPEVENKEHNLWGWFKNLFKK
jgi:cell division protein FtsB